MSVPDLETAEWLRRPETQAIMAALDGMQGRTRAVGGVVRDTILGRLTDSTDLDLATELVPDDVIARAAAAGIASYPTGISHGTVTLKLGATLAEVTTLRRDVETDGRRAVVAFGTDWAEDARRRDFTLNALYCNADGTLFDPLGGLGDALAGRVRFIGDASQRIAEDGLRVYRFFRFSASHGGETFDADGLAACAAAVGTLAHLSAERVGAEMVRMLELPGIARTLGVMGQVGLLDIETPQLRHMLAYEGFGGRSVAARLALLGDLADRRAAWRLPNSLVREAEAIDRAATLVADERIGEAAYRHGNAAVEGLALAAVRHGWRRDRLAEAARELGRLKIPVLPVSGHDLTGLGIAPGPVIGQTLSRLEQKWIESDFTLQKGELLALI